jgi:type II secretory pathway component GspD/PulD (secretin)
MTPLKPQTRIATSAMALLLLPAVLPAQDRQPPLINDIPLLAAIQDGEERQPQVVTRVYSLRPLLQAYRESQRASAAWAPAATSGSPMASESLLTLARYMQGTPAAAQGAAAPVAPAAVAPMDPMDQPTHPATAAVVPQIIEIIMTSVEPDTWVDQGGELGHITFLPVHSSLIVTHTPEVQQKVADLLASIQDRRVVSAQARLVRGDDDAVAAGLKVEQGVSVFEGDVAQLLTVAEVRISGFDGQTQTVKDGRSVRYIAEVQPVVATGSVGYQAIAREIETGLHLRLTPVLSEDGNLLTIEVQAEYALMEDAPATRPAAELTAGAVLLPDLVSVDRRALDLSVRIPAGQWVLIGSMGASRDGEADGEPLHLLIRIDSGNVNRPGDDE